MSDRIDQAEEALWAFMDLAGELKHDAFDIAHLLFIIKNADLMQYYLDNQDRLDDPEVRARAPRGRSEGVEYRTEPTDSTPGIPVEPPMESGIPPQDSTPEPTEFQPESAPDSTSGIAQIVGLILAGNTPTIGDVQRMFGKSHTTAQRWLAKAKKQAETNQPIPLRRKAK